MTKYIALVTILLGHLFPTLSIAQIDTRNVLKVGTNALQYQEYVWAIQCFNDVIHAKPHLWEPYYLRGVAKHYLDDHHGAIADCDSAIVRNPYVVDLYRLRSLSAINTKSFAQAIADYTQAIAMATTPHQQDWFNRALCYIELKQDSLALQSLDTLTRFWPKDDKAYVVKGQIALRRQDTTACYQYLDTALAYQHHQGMALSMYATLLASQQRLAESLPFFQKAITHSPQDARLYFNRALVYYQMKRLGQAISDYNTVIHLSPNHYEARYNRALLNMQIGADNHAIEDLNYVITRTPQHTLARFNRALLHEQVGQYQAAERDLTHVLTHYPNFLYGYEVRARVRQRMGKHKAAANDQTIIARDQLARLYKGKRRGQIQKVRRWEDTDIEDFDNLTLADDDSITTYSVAYRGLVQHKPTALRYQPLFELSFWRNTLQTTSDLHYIPSIEQFNTTTTPTHLLYLSSVRHTADSTDYAIRKATLEQLPQDTTPNILLQRSIALSALRRYDEALATLPPKQGSPPLNALYYWQQATLLQQQTEADSISDDNVRHTIKQAIDKHYEEALKHSPEFRPYYLYNVAQWHAQHHAHSEALQCYNASIALHPLPQAYFNRGLLHHHMGRTAEAIADLSRAGEMGLYEAYSIIKQLTNKAHKTP